MYYIIVQSARLARGIVVIGKSVGCSRHRCRTIARTKETWSDTNERSHDDRDRCVTNRFVAKLCIHLIRKSSRHNDGLARGRRRQSRRKTIIQYSDEVHVAPYDP